MKSIDYEEAKKEIEKLFKNNSDDRKIIFWYDPQKNFFEDVNNDEFDNCKVIVWDNNDYEIKKTVEHDDIDSNFLLYFPIERPKDSENWLLDILMYSEEYYADTVALTMRRLNLTNSDLRNIVERHSKFFDNEIRIKKLNTYIELNDNMNPNDFNLAILCAIVKSEGRSLESVLAEVVFDPDGEKYKEIIKYGYENYLWDCIANHYNYSGDQNISSLIKKFIFTSFISQKQDLDELPNFYEQFVIHGQSKTDAKFFIDRIKTDERYYELQDRVANELKIEGLISSKDISTLSSDTFECVDKLIVNKIIESLNNGSLDYDNFNNIINNRLNSIWYSRYENQYEFIKHIINFFKEVENYITPDLTVNEYIEEYTSNYYKVDNNYRKLCIYYKKIDTHTSSMEELIQKIDDTYEEKFLARIGKYYSDALLKTNDWNFIGKNMSNDFYEISQKQDFKKMFVIISDALRFEIGVDIYEKIKSDPILKGNVELEHMISPLPSETRFGMASLLPHKNIKYENKMIYLDEMQTNTIQARDKILKNVNNCYAAISYDEINNMTQSDIRNYMKDKNIVYIYHNVIDNAGENNESKVFDVSPSAIDEITKLVKKLYNNLQISNFYITADHGFIYRRNKIAESSKYSNIVSLNPLEIAKRYIITNEKLDIPYTISFNLDGDIDVITPYGYDLFKTQGGGMQYVHGGASLQETIVPLIRISELRSRKLINSIRPVGVRLKTISRKITNRSFTLDFEQYEKVEDKKQAITCLTYIEDEQGNKVSGEYKFVANSESDEEDSRITKIRFNLENIEFDRNNKYYLVLKDSNNLDEYIEKEQFVIDIIGFKMF